MALCYWDTCGTVSCPPRAVLRGTVPICIRISQCTPVANEEELKTDGLVSPVNEGRINHQSQE